MSVLTYVIAQVTEASTYQEGGNEMVAGWKRSKDSKIKVIINSWEGHVLPKVINNVPACSKTWGLPEFSLVFIYLCTVF